MLNQITYVLIDAARVDYQRMTEAKELSPSFDSLFRGSKEEELIDVAPHVFRFFSGSKFSNWYLRQSWGQAWGILIKSASPLSVICTHLRKFITVKNESSQELYFRFYDPRVLRIFLPTCDAAQIREFFGLAIDYFIAEDEDPAYAIRFWHENGILKSDRFSVQEIIAALPEPEPLPPPPEDPLPPEAIAALEQMQITLPSQPEVAQPDHPVQPKPEPPKLQPETPVISPKLKSKWNTFD